MLSLQAIVTAFVALFIVMDPFTSVPVFITMTRKFGAAQKRKAAGIALAVATGVFIAFLFLGQYALSLLGIRLESFEIGGGILMLLIAISFALGIEFAGARKNAPVEVVIIGVPLLAGPGTMLTSVLLSNTLGADNVMVAGLAVCASSYAVLLASTSIFRVIGRNGLEILSRVMGVLLAAFAVEYIRKGFGL